MGLHLPSCREPTRSGTVLSRGLAARHARTATSTFGWTDEAAQRGDHAGALGWIEVIRAIGDELPGAYGRKRRQWKLALRAARAPAPVEAGGTADREAAG